MAGQVLVLNAGSSSLKYQVVDPASGAAPVHGIVERIGSGSARLTHADASGEGTQDLDADDHRAALAAVHDALDGSGIGESDLRAVGHRVVHGGPRLTRAHLVDDAVLAEIEHLARLAPLHNPPAVEGIRSARAAYPGLPQVGVELSEPRLRIALAVPAVLELGRDLRYADPTPGHRRLRSAIR